MLKGTQERIHNRKDLLTSIKDYLDISLIRKLISAKSVPFQDKSYQSNDTFWQDVLSNSLYPGQVIKLEHFRVLEWIPSSPGLFHIPYAKHEREDAFRRHFENERNSQSFDSIKSGIIELRPGDKRSMIKGGFGSLRVGPKTIQNELQYIMCATSSGISHEGVVLVMKSESYFKVIEEIKSNRIPLVNLVGRLMLLPNELSLIQLKYNREIPKYYLEVEELEMLIPENSNQGVVSVSITYAREDELRYSDSFSYSFCQFVPTHINGNLKGIVDWLNDYAVRYSNSDNPIIIGDFDEYYNHFEKVEFPICDIANGRVSVDKLHQFQKLFDFTINETTMGDKNIFNNSQIGAVGSNSQAYKNKFQQNVYSIPDNLDFNVLNKELEQLRIILASRATNAEEFKSISEVSEAETASKNKNGEKVVKHLLNAGKWVFDTAKDIGVGVVAELINKQMQQ